MQGSADIVPLEEERSKRQPAASASALENAGAMLRAAREEAGLSLGQVADAINVREERLSAIERMDTAALPGAPYTMGFVRAYADHLDLPIEALVARYREEAGYTRTASAPAIAPPPRDLAEGREVSVLVVLGIVAFAAWCVWQIVQAFAPEEEAALPDGYPIAEYAERSSVEYEVATSLEEELRLAPPERVTEAVEDALAAPADAPSAADPFASAPVAEADAGPAGEAGAQGEAGTVSLLPRVLAPPLAPASEATETAETAGVASAAPSEAAEAAPRVTADALNERLLLETLAASEPSAPAASGMPDLSDGPGNAGRPDAAPAAPTEPAAPVAERAAPQTAALQGPSRTAPNEATPVEARPAPAAIVASAASPAQLTVPVAPVYPTRCESRAADEEVVLVRFGVSRFGKVTGPSVQESTNGCFDRAALAAVARFAFEPATRDGRPVAEGGRTTRVVFRKP